ncbi:lysin A [Mycobacterium phage Redno2]|uniref:endolysin n=1 Tax=Mycobacterium phage Redno2 TaxID=1340709 RepID=UPI000387A87C|nr:endolysin [Mycobacterium phage Redno2]AGS82344.1 lysin A [Mycobacterium phage Redno2]AXQ62455.1 lysin A [Mycobacterium phage Zelink]QDP43795.1 lysin A [Mycobacterium phage Dallas]
MAVTRANVEATKNFIRARVGNPYVYGGALSPTNVRQGTDCSEVWQTVLEMVHGRYNPGRQSEGATTESYRYIPVGGVGPFGTIRVASWRDIPADAVAKIAFHHGPGGGASSHMWGDLDGMLIESAGSKGLVTNGRAMTIDNSYATAWAYLPGPIVEDGSPIPEDPNAVTWGIDISNHQGEMDLNRVKAEGFDFIWCKVSEGANYRDPFWPGNRDKARAAGLILAGYHYVRTGDPAAQAKTFVEHLGDKSIPAMLDFEDGSGNIEQFWAVKNEIEKLGVQVRLSYIPDWYWERIGKPDLSKVPGLISSEYVSGTGYASVLYPGNSSNFWKAYGGRTPDVLQFTDRALVAGKSVDANAFRGTPDKLRRLLGAGGDDFLSALSDAEQRLLFDRTNQLWGALFNPIASLSKYRAEGEGEVHKTKDLVRNIDAMTHETLVERQAMMGNPEALALVKREADKGDKWAACVYKYCTEEA